MKNNNITLVTMLSALSILVVATLLNVTYAQENQITTEQPKFFAIQHAQSGSLLEINDTAYTLELNDVSGKTILFSDRPRNKPNSLCAIKFQSIYNELSGTIFFDSLIALWPV